MHAAKTKVTRCSVILEHARRTENMEDSVEARFSQLTEDRFYDSSPITYLHMDRMGRLSPPSRTGVPPQLGYAVTDAALPKHVIPGLPLPASFPFPRGCTLED